MKKLILSTVALAALTFASCKKDNLQPTTNSATNIEQTNLETTDDDKAVDPRNKFVGKWKCKQLENNVLYYFAINKSAYNTLSVTSFIPFTTNSGGVGGQLFKKMTTTKYQLINNSFDACVRTTKTIITKIGGKLKIVNERSDCDGPIGKQTFINLKKVTDAEYWSVAP